MAYRPAHPTASDRRARQVRQTRDGAGKRHRTGQYLASVAPPPPAPLFRIQKPFLVLLTDSLSLSLFSLSSTPAPAVPSLTVRPTLRGGMLGFFRERNQGEGADPRVPDDRTGDRLRLRDVSAD